MIKKVSLLGLIVVFLLLLAPTRPATACGGLFCQNSPVDQSAERILFSVNPNGSITSLIEIAYTGSAPDFSWILPIPEAISADDLAVPESGDEVFAELHQLTDVQIIPPPPPLCAENLRMRSVEDAVVMESGVEIFASGEVGPFGFDVIGSEDPDALINWLRDNNYRVEPPMEPLINVYVEEGFAFIAMRLLDGETSDSIQPIEITYPGTQPMIPLRLTAVAANPNMPIFTWVFANQQAVPENYAHMEIATEELTFFPFGGNNYQALMMQRADAFDGRAFITEFAGPSRTLQFQNDYLVQQAQQHSYLTRLTTSISPEEMTVDPVFKLEQRPDVSNIRDASNMNGLYSCERDQPAIFNLTSDAIDPVSEEGVIMAEPPQSQSPESQPQQARWPWIVVGAIILICLTGWLLSRERHQNFT